MMANLPPFTPEDPTHWLKLCDAHFNFKKIECPQEKIYAIITSLTYELQRELDVALGYTTEEQYKEFKTMLLAATALPAQKRINQLISNEELGDRKPSIFLRHLKNLAGSQADNEEFIRPLFLKRLPASISQILASMPDSSVDNLAKSADAIIQYQADSLGNVNAYGGPHRQESKPQSNVDDQMRFMRSTIANLTDQIQDLVRRLQKLETSVSNNRGRSNNRYRSYSRPSHGARTGMCYYHTKFGSRATKCSQPCSYGNETPK